MVIVVASIPLQLLAMTVKRKKRGPKDAKEAEVLIAADAVHRSPPKPLKQSGPPIAHGVPNAAGAVSRWPSSPDEAPWSAIAVGVLMAAGLIIVHALGTLASRAE
jgi:hypothetical protein